MRAGPSPGGTGSLGNFQPARTSRKLSFDPMSDPVRLIPTFAEMGTRMPGASSSTKLALRDAMLAALDGKIIFDATTDPESRASLQYVERALRSTSQAWDILDTPTPQYGDAGLLPHFFPEEESELRFVSSDSTLEKGRVIRESILSKKYGDDVERLSSMPLAQGRGILRLISELGTMARGDGDPKVLEAALAYRYGDAVVRGLKGGGGVEFIGLVNSFEPSYSEGDSGSNLTIWEDMRGAILGAMFYKNLESSSYERPYAIYRGGNIKTLVDLLSSSAEDAARSDMGMSAGDLNAIMDMFPDVRHDLVMEGMDSPSGLSLLKSLVLKV
jgi:hypothetical protein